MSIAGITLSRRTAFVALAALALPLAPALMSWSALAQEERGSIPGLTLTSNSPGELTISWGGPEPVPSDYRIAWAPVGGGLPLARGRRREGGRGNACPGGTARSHINTASRLNKIVT